jgi:hypothetical protein
MQVSSSELNAMKPADIGIPSKVNILDAARKKNSKNVY